MGDIQDTQVIDPATGKPTATPEVVPTPNPDPAAEVAEIRRKNEELSKQVADKDRYITDLANEKATLEARLSQINKSADTTVVDKDIEAQAKNILEMAQIDPEKAAHDLAAMIKATQDKTQKDLLSNLGPIISQTTYINEVRKNHQDLIDIGLEPQITIRANQLMQSGKSFKEAVDMAVTEARKRVDKIKSNAPPPAPPAGAIAETGANPPPVTPPVPVEKTAQDEVADRFALRAKKGL